MKGVNCNANKLYDNLPLMKQKRRPPRLYHDSDHYWLSTQFLTLFCELQFQYRISSFKCYKFIKFFVHLPICCYVFIYVSGIFIKENCKLKLSSQKVSDIYNLHQIKNLVCAMTAWSLKVFVIFPHLHKPTCSIHDLAFKPFQNIYFVPNFQANSPVTSRAGVPNLENNYASCRLQIQLVISL